MDAATGMEDAPGGLGAILTQMDTKVITTHFHLSHVNLRTMKRTILLSCWKLQQQFGEWTFLMSTRGKAIHSFLRIQTVGEIRRSTDCKLLFSNTILLFNTKKVQPWQLTIYPGFPHYPWTLQLTGLQLCIHFKLIFLSSRTKTKTFKQFCSSCKQVNGFRICQNANWEHFPH